MCFSYLLIIVVVLVVVEVVLGVFVVGGGGVLVEFVVVEMVSRLSLLLFVILITVSAAVFVASIHTYQWLISLDMNEMFHIFISSPFPFFKIPFLHFSNSLTIHFSIEISTDDFSLPFSKLLSSYFYLVKFAQKLLQFFFLPSHIYKDLISPYFSFLLYTFFHISINFELN